MLGRMSVVALNAGPNISVTCVVYMPGPSAYQLHSHYHYHHPSLLLLVLFPINCQALCAVPHCQHNLLLVCPQEEHTLSHLPYENRHSKTRTGAVMSRDRRCGCADRCDTVRRSPKPRRPEIICMAWTWE
jgi:hypothetical protein